MDKRDFWLAKLSVGGLLISTAVLVVAGVLSLFGQIIGDWAPVLKAACILGFAGIAGFALAVAQAAASCAQVLDGEEFTGARRVAYLCAAITGAVSLAGVYLGDAVLNGHPVTLPPLEVMLFAGFLLAFIKPAMTFVITACETKERGRLDAGDAVIAAKDARIVELERQLREVRAANPTPAEKPAETNPQPVSQPRPVRAQQRAARELAKELRSGSMKTRQAAPQANERPVRERAPPLTEQEVRDVLAKMTAAGIKGEVISLNAVRKFAGVPYSRVERSPGRHLIEAAAA